MNRQYETHIPVLEFIMDNFDIQSVLELGMGRSSTNFFKKFTDISIVSVDSSQTYAKILESTENHKVVVSPLLQYVMQREDQYDLAFVDGNPANERWLCVKELFNKAGIIVAHDTAPKDDWNYHYSKIELPENFVRIDYKKDYPWTSVYTARDDAKEKILRFCMDTM